MGRAWKELTLDSYYYSDLRSSKKLICKECNTEYIVECTRETNWDGTHDSYDIIVKECSCGQCK